MHTPKSERKQCHVALSPGSLIFSTLHEKRGEPGKTYHVREVRWNQLPYNMAQQQFDQMPRVRVLQSVCYNQL